MNRLKDLPNRLECAYCKRNYKHGGECQGKSTNRNEDGCLYFSMDEKGCIRNTDQSIPFNLLVIFHQLVCGEMDGQYIIKILKSE